MRVLFNERQLPFRRLFSQRSTQSEVSSLTQEKVICEENNSPSQSRRPVYEELSFYCSISKKTGKTTSDLGDVPSKQRQEFLENKAKHDRVLQDVCEKEISLAYLMRHPTERQCPGFIQQTTATISHPTLFPKVFELFVPRDVLTYLFYAIGREYGGGGGDGGGGDVEFNIDEHMAYTAQESSQVQCNEAATSLITNKRTEIKEVGVLYDRQHEISNIFV